MNEFQESVAGAIARIEQRLVEIEYTLTTLLGQTKNTETVTEYVSTAVAAKLLDRAEFTIRQHLRNKRIRAKQLRNGHYRISREEIRRIKDEGLDPPDNHLH